MERGSGGVRLQEWTSTFGSHAPFTGATIGDYVTENYDAFPLA